MEPASAATAISWSLKGKPRNARVAAARLPSAASSAVRVTAAPTTAFSASSIRLRIPGSHGATAATASGRDAVAPWEPGILSLMDEAEKAVVGAGPAHQSDGLADAVGVRGEVLDDPTGAEVGVVTAEPAAAEARQRAGVLVGQGRQHSLPVQVAIANGPLQ